MSEQEKLKIFNIMKNYRITKAFAAKLRVLELETICVMGTAKITRIDGKGGAVFIPVTCLDNRSAKTAADHIIRLLET